MVAPDFFKGDPYVANDPNRPIKEWLQEHGPVSSCLSFHYCNVFLIDYYLSSAAAAEVV